MGSLQSPIARSRSTAAPLVEQAALAMVKQLVEQGRGKEVLRVLKQNPAGARVLKEAFPGPTKVLAVLNGFTDDPIDNIYGYLLEDDDSRWLFTLLEYVDMNGPNCNLAPGLRHRLGGVFLHCEDQEAVVEMLVGAIGALDIDDFNEVVKRGLRIEIDEDAYMAENEDEEEDDEEGGGEAQQVFDHSDWVQSSRFSILHDPIVEKLNDLVDDRKLASQERVDELMRPNRGVVIMGTIIVNANSWE